MHWLNLSKIIFWRFYNTEIAFFLHPISSFHLLVHPLFGAWSPQWCRPLHMVGLLLCDVLLAGPISSGSRRNHNPLSQRNDGYIVLPIDGSLSIPVIFFEESKWGIMQIYFIAGKKLLAYSCYWTRVAAVNNFIKQILSLWARRLCIQL